MQDTGTLKIRSFFALDRDDHGREISGKWLTVLTKHGITRDQAEEVFTKVKASNPEDRHLHATFTIEEHLY